MAITKQLIVSVTISETASVRYMRNKTAKQQRIAQHGPVERTPAHTGSLWIFIAGSFWRIVTRISCSCSSVTCGRQVRYFARRLVDCQSRRRRQQQREGAE